jgi:DNA-binding NarL/FixJ family response regulator
MTPVSTSCVLLADRHHRLIECVRDMLDTEFATLFIVTKENSLTEGAIHLQPTVVIADLSLVPDRLSQVLHRLRACSPHT